MMWQTWDLQADGWRFMQEQNMRFALEAAYNVDAIDMSRPSSGEVARLKSNVDALLELDAKGALVPHGIGGHARELLKQSSDLLERLAIDAQRVRREDGWQPIETCPSDGTEIITYNNLIGVKVREADGDWWRSNHSGITAIPTHWRPLPSPPSTPETKP